MFFTRTLVAAMLFSAGFSVAHAAAAKSARATLTVTATIPPATPTLTFTGSKTISLPFNETDDTLDVVKADFTLTGNSGLTLYLENAAVLKHEVLDQNSIALKVSAKVGTGAPTVLQPKSSGAGFVARKASDTSNVETAVRGTLIVEPAHATKIAETRVGTYAGDITVIVEANDDDAAASI